MPVVANQLAFMDSIYIRSPAQTRKAGHKFILSTLDSRERAPWMHLILKSPISELFSPSGVQPLQLKLAHKLQLTDGCRAIFHICCFYTKHGGIMTNLTLWNLWRYITDMSKYQNACILSMDQKLLIFMFKTLKPSRSLSKPPVSWRQAAMGTRICETSLLSLE